MEYESHNVIRNPNMYYFSSALKLHIRVKRAREGLPIACDQANPRTRVIPDDKESTE